MDVELRARVPAFRALQHTAQSGSVVMFGGLMLGNAIAYVYHMLMARLMSPAEYGALVTLTALSYVLTVLMRTVQAWIIRVVAGQRQAGASNVRAVFMAALRALTPLGGLALLAHWLVRDIVADFLHLRSGAPIVALGLITFSSFLVPIPRGALLGLKRMHAPGLVYVLEPIVRLGSGVALVLLGLGVNGALLSFTLGNLAAFALLTMALWPLLRRRERAATDTPAPSLDRYALQVLVINSCLMLMTSLDQVAVKHYFAPETAGNYAVAFLLGQVIAMSTISLGWVVFTRSATMAPDDPEHIRLLIKGLALIGALAASLTTGYLTLPTLAVRLMGGAQYSAAHAYIGLVGVEMTLFALVYIQVYYQIGVHKLHTLWPLCLAALLEIALITQFHDTVQHILACVIAVMSGLLAWVSLLSWRMFRVDRAAVTLKGPQL
jgi:O-antigen/teichoic acid export membrane protein